MLSDIDFPKSQEYRTGTDNEPFAFYMEALVESNQFDLLLGYFSSSAISVLALGFAKFISNGGRVRLIINHVLSANDKAAIIEGANTAADLYEFSIHDFQSLRKALDEYSDHFFACLAWLIASKRVQIRAIKPKDKRGISHYKSGTFYDGVNKVRFKGSCNFTASGLIENLEELDVKLSWKVGNDAFTEYEAYFDELFDGRSDYAEIVPIEQIEAAIVRDYGGKELDELLIDEQRLVIKKAQQTRSVLYQTAVKRILRKIDTYLTTPRFPYESGPRDYQNEAYHNWINNGFQGIFAMATGTGKTITSLNCVLNEYVSTGRYQAVILVPTTVLVEQWEKEARKFNFREVIKVSSKSPGWHGELDRITTQLSFGMATSFIVIVTYKSFTKDRFQRAFKRLSAESVLLADEAHNIGSPSLLRLLGGVHLQKRIGLSATPKRVYDPEGSERMEAFFHDQEPYTYSFSMERAIDEEILCPYFYYPKLVELTSDELVEYTKITTKLVKLYSRVGRDDKASQAVEQLLMQRKRIIHKAQGKLTVFEDILTQIQRSRGQIGYTLVYAPEGYYSDDEMNEDKYPDLTEENRIIDFYASVVRRLLPETTITQYTSESADKDLVLKQFEQGRINMLLSMKCLDEGVDIPRTEQAIFCSSTGNPRQFIQRRGRILRKHPEKDFAYIHDMVVIARADPNTTNFELERKLVQKELERVVHFAYMALNKYEAIEVFRDVCNYYELNLDTIHTDLVA
ncbi:DEAD/DEAH box helicase family protein [Spirosoma pomorum]